jgi:hypothetical protein
LPIENGIFDGKKVAFQFAGQDGRVYRASLVSASEDCLEGTLEFALQDGTPMAGKLTLKRKKMP